MNPSNTLVPHLDPIAVQRERRLWSGAAPWLHEEVGQQMAERLRWFSQAPSTWLDWEPSWGGLKAHSAIAKHFPRAKRWVHEPKSESLSGASKWRWPWARAGAQWDGTTSVDMVWANMGLRGIPDPQTLVGRWLKALKPGGILMFSALGPHTLESVRRIYLEQGWGAAMTPLTDMHDWGDMLVAASFSDPVLDSSFLDLTYSDSHALLADLRTLGSNTHDQRFSGCRARHWRDRWHAALQAGLPRDESGRLVLRIEVIWGHATAPQGVAVQAGETAISVDRMRDILGDSRSK